MADNEKKHDSKKTDSDSDKTKAKKSAEGEKKSAAAEKKTAAKPKAGDAAQAAAKGAKKASAKGPKTPGAKRAPLAPKTYFAKTGEVKANWRVIDATGLTLGRLSTYIAGALMGKDKPNFTPFSDTGDHVVVINAEKVRLTGTKLENKKYYYHTNYPGGIKEFTARQLLETHPDRLIKWSVWGMLPKAKGHMVRHWYKKLRVFAGPNHPHAAQQPTAPKLPNLGIR